MGQYYYPSYQYNTYPYYRGSYYGVNRVYSPRVVLPSSVAAPVAAPLIRTVANKDFQSPSAQAALSYLQENTALDTCGEQTKAYIDIVANGGSREEAAAIATQVYQRNHLARAALSPACLAAEVAWKNAVAVGRDPVLDAALAFMDASPSESPCYVSAKDYISAINGGVSHTDAGLQAAKSFANQIVNLANQGKPTVDPACARSALAYATKSDTPSSPAAAAMTAFIQKSLEEGASFDPVCLASTQRFWQSYESGRDEQTNTLEAARDFVRSYSANPTAAGRSPCAAAAKAYAQAIFAAPSNPAKAALYAFIDNAILSNDQGVDPVCAASSEAYFNAYISGAGEAAASEAAAVAYLNAVEANPAFDPKSPCGRAADAYIATFRK